MARVLAWHWTNGSKLRDGRPVPPIGKWRTHRGPVKICSSGLHASEMLVDSLNYAPGAVLHRVECSRPVELHSDKLVCRRRRILASADMLQALPEFARQCAVRARAYAAATAHAAADAAYAAADAAYAAAAADAYDAAADAAYAAAAAADATAAAADATAARAAAYAARAARAADATEAADATAARAAERQWQESTLRLYAAMFGLE